MRVHTEISDYEAVLLRRYSYVHGRHGRHGVDFRDIYVAARRAKPGDLDQAIMARALALTTRSQLPQSMWREFQSLPAIAAEFRGDDEDLLRSLRRPSYGDLERENAKLRAKVAELTRKLARGG